MIAIQDVEIRRYAALCIRATRRRVAENGYRRRPRRWTLLAASSLLAWRATGARVGGEGQDLADEMERAAAALRAAATL